jgi:Zn-finger nucleic acid-binding protein
LIRDEAGLFRALGLSVVCLVAMLWVRGHPAAACVLALVPIGGYFASPYVDKALVRMIASWRSSRFVREAGKLYCPECVRELADAPAGKAPARRECPGCRGAWCGDEDFSRWLAPYETGASGWRAHSSEGEGHLPLCPRCAGVMESGVFVNVRPNLRRCEACRGFWVSNVAWVWFRLNPPRAGRA